MNKKTITLAIISLLALAAIAIFVLVSKSEIKQHDTVIPEKDAVSERTAIAEAPTNQEELNKRKDSIWWETEKRGKWLDDRDEGYAKEQERFAKVLQQASDEELFAVLNYALAHRYVPNRAVDPYRYVFAGITPLHRTYLIYE